MLHSFFFLVKMLMKEQWFVHNFTHSVQETLLELILEQTVS